MNKVLKVTLELQDLDPGSAKLDNFAAAVSMSSDDLKEHNPQIAIQLGATLAGLLKNMIPSGTEGIVVIFEKTPSET